MLDIPVLILLFILIIIALVLGARALLVSKNMHSSSSYLAWFMIYVTLVNLQLWLAFVKPSSLYPDLFLFFFPFELLPAPFFLLFTRSYLDQDPPSLKERMLLFAPFWIFFTGYLYIKWDMLINDLSYKVAWDKYFPIFKIEEVAALVYGIIIIVVAFQDVLSFEKVHGKKRFSQVVAQTQWIKKVIYIGTGLVVLWILAFLFDLVSVYRIGNYAYVPAWIGYLLFIIYIGYYGFEQTSVLTERKKLNHFANEERVTSSFTNETSEPSTLKYFQELEKYMMFDKMYLNPYLDLNSLADKLHISPNYLSKIVNSHAKVNFSDYVNTYRISYAKKMLAAIEFKEYNMLSIALESGFNSKSSFYAAFNKLLGQPPGYFRSHKQS